MAFYGGYFNVNLFNRNVFSVYLTLTQLIEFEVLFILLTH